MKKTSYFLVLLISFIGFAQENYQVQIGQQSIPVELDKTYTIELDGKSYNLKFVENEKFTYQAEDISFKHPKGYNPNKVQLEAGIEQIVLMTAEGAGFIIQKYESIDPSMMKELMLNEVTKESKNYGFSESREDYTRTLKDGTKINIIRSVLNYKNEINIYEIASISKRDEGFLLMTMQMDDNPNSAGKKLIKTIWDSIQFYK